MSMHSHSGGRPRTASRKGKDSTVSKKRKEVKDDISITLKPMKHSRRIKSPAPGFIPEKIAGTACRDMTVVIHDEKAADNLSAADLYLRNRRIVHRAMELLEKWKFLPARIVSAQLPVDIIAMREDVEILAQVISSRHPIPDVNTLYRSYARKIDSLRLMDVARRYRKIIMSYSMPFGWKHYDVLSGGLIPAWDLHKLPVA